MKRFWHEITTLRTGLGQVEVLEMAEDELASVLSACHGDIIVLGNGSNVVGLDDDWSGTVIRFQSGKLEIIEDNKVRASACMSLPKLADWCASNGLGGMAALSGIPASVGGALAMNAGANGVEISQYVETISGIVCSTGEHWQYSRENGGWGYRTSPVPSDVIITEAVFCFPKVQCDVEQAAIKAERSRRAQVTPRGRSAGSVFRNPNAEHSAGWYLEQAGCKGMKIGNLEVSEQHANWIVNLSGDPAAAKDFIALREKMHQNVLEKFDIDLHSEVILPEQAHGGIKC